MNWLVHKLVICLTAILIAAAPAWCICSDHAPAEKENAQEHACCSQQQKPVDSSGKHSPACSHCGEQKIRVTVEHSPVVDLALHFVGLQPLAESPVYMVSSATYRLVHESPPVQFTPVSLHSISLT